MLTVASLELEPDPATADDFSAALPIAGSNAIDVASAHVNKALLMERTEHLLRNGGVCDVVDCDAHGVTSPF
jgi:hypothetical protein